MEEINLSEGKGIWIGPWIEKKDMSTRFLVRMSDSTKVYSKGPLLIDICVLQSNATDDAWFVAFHDFKMEKPVIFDNGLNYKRRDQAMLAAEEFIQKHYGA